jgi:hypothetical protein
MTGGWTYGSAAFLLFSQFSPHLCNNAKAHKIYYIIMLCQAQEEIKQES